MVKKISQEKLECIISQIDEKSTSYEYSTKEYPLEVIYNKFGDENNPDVDIYVPSYQREFVWKPDMQSKFIESLILGVPITPILFARDKSARYEIVDGSQRIRTIMAFLDGKLRLRGLKTLTELNGLKFLELPAHIKRNFQKRDFRVLDITKNSNTDIRHDIFERINTTGVKLSDSDIRKGSYKGKFYDLILELIRNEDFKNICPISDKKQKAGEREELLLRFFAFKDKYLEFKHDVAIFLNSYLEDMNELIEIKEELRESYVQDFIGMLDFVKKTFPLGFKKALNINMTPRVRFEAISVGSFLAMKTGLPINNDLSWLEPSKDPKNKTEFEKLVTSDSSNNPGRLKDRIEYVRNKLLDV